MSKVVDKAAAIAAFRQSARPTADSIRQWSDFDGDVGAGSQQVFKSLLGRFVAAFHAYSVPEVKLPETLARAFQHYNMSGARPQRHVRRVSDSRQAHSRNVIPNPCR